MKQWFRKAALCLALALSVMALVACGSTEKEIAPIDPSIKSALETQAKQYVQDNIYTKSVDDILAQIAAAEDNKDVITYNGLTNYKNDLDRLGKFVSVDNAVATKTAKGYSIEIDSTFEKRKLKLTLGINEKTGATTEMTFEPAYTFSEEMADAAGNLAVGMGTVFVVLIFIAWIISLFKYVNVFTSKKEAAPKAAPKAATPAPKAAPAAPKATAQDDQIQAVIAAAIAAYEADTATTGNGFVAGPTLNNGLVVRPIRRHGYVPTAETSVSAPVVTNVAPVANTATAAAAPAAPKVAGSAGSVKVDSPMPGKILAVKKNVGDAVKSGDVILVLEAMKMENDIVAPQDGTVASINVSVGDAVESGATLATLN